MLGEPQNGSINIDFTEFDRLNAAGVIQLMRSDDLTIVQVQKKIYDTSTGEQKGWENWNGQITATKLENQIADYQAKIAAIIKFKTDVGL